MKSGYFLDDFPKQLPKSGSVCVRRHSDVDYIWRIRVSGASVRGPGRRRVGIRVKCGIMNVEAADKRHTRCSMLLTQDVRNT